MELLDFNIDTVEEPMHKTFVLKISLRLILLFLHLHNFFFCCYIVISTFGHYKAILQQYIHTTLNAVVSVMLTKL